MPRRTKVFKDYYSILNVSQSSSLEEIKKSFRKLALELHPDHNPNDPESEERFKEITEAYGVLSDHPISAIPRKTFLPACSAVKMPVKFLKSSIGSSAALASVPGIHFSRPCFSAVP